MGIFKRTLFGTIMLWSTRREVLVLLKSLGDAGAAVGEANKTRLRTPDINERGSEVTKNDSKAPTQNAICCYTMKEWQKD
jgi:hypothetical protein